MTIWEILQEAVAPVVTERPANSVTIEEYAEAQALSASHAARVLRELAAARNPKLRAVNYRTKAGRRGRCYVPVSA